MKEQTIHFTKMHGLGNDFIVIDQTHQAFDWHTLPVKQLANRHLGIGCDQILIIQSSQQADFFCRILNADGSEAEQCGNGLRCVGRYVHDKKLHAGSSFTIETIAGVFPIEIINDGLIRVTIPAENIEASAVQLELTPAGSTVKGSSLSMGNPHFIIQVPDVQTVEAGQIGSAVATHPIFPQGTNVGFMQIMNKNHIRLRTYERGAGETNACGSNACAAVASGILAGSLQQSVQVDFKYGQLQIEWEGKGKPVHMNGPAVTVFEGEFKLTK